MRYSGMDGPGVYVGHDYKADETTEEGLARWNEEIEKCHAAVAKRMELLPLIVQAAKDGVAAICGMGYEGQATIDWGGIGCDMKPKLYIYANTQLYQHNEIGDLSERVLAAVVAAVKLPYVKAYSSGHPSSESARRGAGVTVGFLFHR